MKSKIFLLLIAVFALFSFKGEKQKLNGTWKVVSAMVIKDGNITTNIKADEKSNQIKTWSDNYFLFVGRFQNGDNVQHNFGGGTYSLHGKHYTENIQYHVAPANVGKNIKMLLEIKGDTLIQTFPATDDWKIDKNNCQIEKHVRLD